MLKRAKEKISASTVTRQSIVLLLSALFFCILPLLFRLPVWFSFITLFVLSWRWQIAIGRLTYPKTALKFAVTLSCLLILFFSYRYALGVESMVAFLLCGYLLKLLELRTQNDALLVTFLGFVAVSTQLLFSQSVLAALYAGFCCLLLLNSWKLIFFAEKQSSLLRVKGSFYLLLQALPLMLVMFVVMPRLPPLWKANLFNSSGETGFSENLSPGDLSRLVQDQGTAFRVQFEGAAPAVNKMYWRGLVLDHFDGRSWSLSKSWQHNVSNKQRVNEKLEQFSYQVTLEAHQYQWLFSLEQLVKLDSGSFPTSINADGLIYSNLPVSKRVQYQAISQMGVGITQEQLNEAQYKMLTHLPEGFNPEAIALSKSWFEQGLTEMQLVEKALTWYEQEFYYTLQPPRLGEHSVDEFLFSTQRGFCEHYASSFVVLMRAAGIPARVVVGYLGAVENPEQGYWIVRQANAHAWAEVWVDGRWLRIDPTHAVAPERVEQGIESALDNSEQALVASGLLTSPDWLTQMRFQLDALNYQWNRWVLSYDQRSQRNLFKKIFGNFSSWRIGLLFVALLTAAIALLAFITLRSKKEKQSEFQKALNKFDKYCQSIGITRQKKESLAVFASRLASNRPDLVPACNELTRVSQLVLYQNNSSDKNPKAFDNYGNKVILIHLLKTFPKHQSSKNVS